MHLSRATVKGAGKAGGLILAAIVLIQRFDGDPDLAANLTRGEGAGPDLIFELLQVLAVCLHGRPNRQKATLSRRGRLP